jgi:hypothetical protein
MKKTFIGTDLSKEIASKLKLEQQVKAFQCKNNEGKLPLVQGGEDASVTEKRNFIKSVRTRKLNICIDIDFLLYPI